MIQILNTYETNPSAMAIIPAAHLDYASIILEQNRTVYCKQPPLQIIKTACLDGGSTYDGRRKAVTHLTGAYQKVPIPINPQSNIFAFPTTSPTTFECKWIFYHHVKAILPHTSPNQQTQSNIIFKNNETHAFEESHYTLQKQMQRTAICILQFAQPESLMINQTFN